MARRKTARSTASSAKGVRKPAKRSPYSEPWMSAFVTDALKSLDLIECCKTHEVSLADVVDYRAKDPAFNAALIEVDRSIELAVGAGLKARAAAGDGRATSLLLRRQEELKQLGSTNEGTLDPRVAEAVLAAALLASGSIDPPTCPLCGANRPRKKERKWPAASPPPREALSIEANLDRS